MKIGNITRTQTVQRAPAPTASASEPSRQASIAHQITPLVGMYRATTTITTTVTLTPTDSTAPYQPTTERFRLRSLGADQASNEEDIPPTASLAPQAAPQEPLGDQVMDHLVQYFHAVETARLARFLASVKVARNARADKAVQLAQAYANHE